MKYVSTRGHAPTLNFEEVVLTGLASDGGLYVPEKWPRFTEQELKLMASASYSELAYQVMCPFVGDSLTEDELREIIAKAYSSFRHFAIAPLTQIGHNEWVMELFHGPTLAFKDFALQFLGHLLDFFLARRGQRVVVLGATSGDTGSAAIEGCRRCENIDIFILHPHQRVSEVQRRQMTTVLSDNVFNLAVKGNFDDCQSIVKQSFRDQTFLCDGRKLVAVNSINWARIMAQIVYYFHAALALNAPNKSVAFSVPTGNFGDIFAGYVAKQMGLPVSQLVIATNENDILHRCLSANDHSRQALKQSLSPSMDIMVSSNFERLLFDLYERDGLMVERLLESFGSGSMVLSDTALAKARTLFSSFRQNDDQMLQVMRDVYAGSAYVADPHTAIGIAAAREMRWSHATPIVCVATAHPAKFPEAISRAGLAKPELPNGMQNMFAHDERYHVIDNDLTSVHDYIRSRLS